MSPLVSTEVQRWRNGDTAVAQTLPRARHVTGWGRWNCPVKPLESLELSLEPLAGWTIVAHCDATRSLGWLDFKAGYTIPAPHLVLFSPPPPDGECHTIQGNDTKYWVKQNSKLWRSTLHKPEGDAQTHWAKNSYKPNSLLNTKVGNIVVI